MSLLAGIITSVSLVWPYAVLADPTEALALDFVLTPARDADDAERLASGLAAQLDWLKAHGYRPAPATVAATASPPLRGWVQLRFHGPATAFEQQVVPLLHAFDAPATLLLDDTAAQLAAEAASRERLAGEPYLRLQQARGEDRANAALPELRLDSGIDQLIRQLEPGAAADAAH
jgi:hypothetical protein